MATATRPTSVLLDDVSRDDYEAQLRIVGDRPIQVHYDRGRMEIVSPVWWEGVSWADYEEQHRIIGSRRLRVTYDSGSMEIMAPILWRHGNDGYLLGRMVDTLAEELDIPFAGADPVTLKRPELGKGVEPDRLYFFGENAAKVRSIRDLDLAVYPPPDLVIEVDLTSSSIPRLPVFAALGIPEVWRAEAGEDLLFLHLQPDRTYQTQTHSRVFPPLPVAEAARFLEQGRDTDAATWIRAFRAYVRDTLVPRA